MNQLTIQGPFGVLYSFESIDQQQQYRETSSRHAPPPKLRHEDDLVDHIHSFSPLPLPPHFVDSLQPHLPKKMIESIQAGLNLGVSPAVARIEPWFRTFDRAQMSGSEI